MVVETVVGTADIDRIEAPRNLRAYFICAFSSFGGILFGYDSGYINGVLAMPYVKQKFGGPVSMEADETGFNIETWQKSLIVSILSLGTFLGALCAGSIAEWLGRRTTIMLSCFIFSVGVALQVASTSVSLLVPGRLVAGLGVGGVSTVVILYVSEIAPKKIRGMLVSIYQFAITIGLLLSSCVDKATTDLYTSASYRIPIGIQFLWALILGLGLFFLPESPRFYVKENKLGKAAEALAIVRGQPKDSEYVKAELAEIRANYEYERQLTNTRWLDCFKGGLSLRANAGRVVTGMALQMFQQWTGVNFIFYYGTTFFQQVGLQNAFMISVITGVVNVVSTPVSFYTVERLGRRALLIWGAALMLVCEFIVAAVGTAKEGSKDASICLIVFVCIYIFGFASTWGPGAWVVVGEIFPLPIRAKGVALSVASNWLWNCIIAVITPYLVDPGKGNMGAKVFFLWGATCTLSLIFAYFCIPESKGLSLEQMDHMLEETSPRTSKNWKPRETFARTMGKIADTPGGIA